MIVEGDKWLLVIVDGGMNRVSVRDRPRKKDLEEIVEGAYQSIYAIMPGKYCAVANIDSRLNGMRASCVIGSVRLLGPIVVMKMDRDEESGEVDVLCALSDEEVEECEKLVFVIR